MYKVKTSDDIEGYFYKKYVVDTEDALEIHGDAIYEIHSSKKDTLGGGDGASLDYYPVVKPVFEDNKMPDNVYSLYLNGTKSVISNVDDYIAYAKTTNINAFVVDIKERRREALLSRDVSQISRIKFQDEAACSEHRVLLKLDGSRYLTCFGIVG